MAAPEEGVGGHGDQYQPSWLQPLHHVAQGALVVFERGLQGTF